MALDFYKSGTQEILFSLDDAQYDNLTEIIEAFRQRTGIFIDQYANMQLTVENQKTLITIIDQYIDKTDLNRDKKKTVIILQFRGLLLYFSNRNFDFKLVGD